MLQTSSTSRRPVLRTASLVFAFASSPLVGAIAGGIAASWLTPGSVAMLGVFYAGAGSIVAYGLTLLIGIPGYIYLRRSERSLLPRFIGLALWVGLGAALLIQAVLSGGKNLMPSITNLAFAAVSSVVTALLIVLMCREADEL